MENIGTGPPLLSDRFASAMQYALMVHRHQIRKNAGIPYFAHLMSVSALVVENGGDEDEAIAALLHDAVEDQGGAEQLSQIRKLFGDRIANLVEGCTDTDALKLGAKEDWWTRKRRHVAHLEQVDPDVLRIVAADKLHNARSILQDIRKFGASAFDRFSQGKEGTLWYYGEMSRIANALLGGFLAEELDRVVRKIREKAK